MFKIPGLFGPIPVGSGHFGPSRFSQISKVSNFCPISKVGHFGPILGVSCFGLIYLFKEILG